MKNNELEEICLAEFNEAHFPKGLLELADDTFATIIRTCDVHPAIDSLLALDLDMFKDYAGYIPHTNRLGILIQQYLNNAKLLGMKTTKVNHIHDFIVLYVFIHRTFKSQAFKTLNTYLPELMRIENLLVLELEKKILKVRTKLLENNNWTWEEVFKELS